jgi:hypothetical protein
MRELFRLQGMEVTQLGHHYCKNSIEIHKIQRNLNKNCLDFQKIQCLFTITIVRIYLRGDLL